MKIALEVVEAKLFAGVIADEIIYSAKEVLANQKNFHISLAGGGTPGEIYRALSLSPRSSSMPWSETKVFLGDERFVSQDDTQSNSRMVRETLLSHAESKVCKYFPINTEVASPQESATQYANTLKAELPLENGAPCFDMVLLGLGEDGHIASLFPGAQILIDSALQDTTSLVAPAKNPNDNTERISLSPAVILNSKRILLMVKGANKAKIVADFLKGATSVSVDKFPALMLYKVADKLTLYADSAAATKIPRDLF
jgi:6-phosphogluconolactonase